MTTNTVLYTPNLCGLFGGFVSEDERPKIDFCAKRELTRAVLETDPDTPLIVAQYSQPTEAEIEYLLVIGQRDASKLRIIVPRLLDQFGGNMPKTIAADQELCRELRGISGLTYRFYIGTPEVMFMAVGVGATTVTSCPGHIAEGEVVELNDKARQIEWLTEFGFDKKLVPLPRVTTVDFARLRSHVPPVLNRGNACILRLTKAAGGLGSMKVTRRKVMSDGPSHRYNTGAILTYLRDKIPEHWLGRDVLVDKKYHTMQDLAIIMDTRVDSPEKIKRGVVVERFVLDDIESGGVIYSPLMAIEEGQLKVLHEIAMAKAKWLWKYGYRSVFDMDCSTTLRGKPAWWEFNIRDVASLTALAVGERYEINNGWDSVLSIDGLEIPTDIDLVNMFDRLQLQKDGRLHMLGRIMVAGLPSGGMVRDIKMVVTAWKPGKLSCVLHGDRADITEARRALLSWKAHSRSAGDTHVASPTTA